MPIIRPMHAAPTQNRGAGSGVGLGSSRGLGRNCRPRMEKRTIPAKAESNPTGLIVPLPHPHNPASRPGLRTEAPRVLNRKVKVATRGRRLQPKRERLIGCDDDGPAAHRRARGRAQYCYDSVYLAGQLAIKAFDLRKRPS
jgi:hypothetical protein